VTHEQNVLIELLEDLRALEPNERINRLANYLGYRVGVNPVDPENKWSMLLHEDFDPGEQAVLAVIQDDDLTETTLIREVRQRHQLVIELADSLGASYNVPLAAFVGEGRIVLYRVGAGNRDQRLDLTEHSVSKVSLYADHFNGKLMKDRIQLEEDEFGFGYDIAGLDDLFKRALSGRFQQMIELYRKKLSEAIVGSKVHKLIEPLLIDDAKEFLKYKEIARLVEDNSFKAGLGCVVDTIILRQLLRRFLEGYHGTDTFNASGVALGVGAGTLEDALNEVVQVYRPNADDQALKKALGKNKPVSEQLTMFNLFDDDESAVTAEVKFDTGGKESLFDLCHRLRQQFEITYGGDLFAGSVAEVTNRIEQAIAKDWPELIAKLWADTSTEQYSFRYEDLPPELLQQQYEASMSRTVQIRIDDDKPVVYYGDDTQEQKSKGAYYTNTNLVEYMVKQALEPSFNKRIEAIREALESNEQTNLDQKIQHLLSLKVVDITCGGGSFLRGVFYWLADRHQVLSRLGLSAEICKRYPMFNGTEAGRHHWEKHLLTNVIYGIDIDFKALIICSQTLTLSALRYWEVGKGFPELIGQTLIHQNALISPVPLAERKSAFAPFKNQIKKLISLRFQAAVGNKEARKEAEKLRQSLNIVFKSKAHDQLGDSAEPLRVECIELNIPEVFFHSDGTWNEEGGFDVALGNPPWEGWKSNEDEYFERYDPGYRKANKQQKLKLTQQLFKVYPMLKTRWEAQESIYAVGSKHFLNDKYYGYQRWKVDGKFTGSDVNLYKVSLERFYQMLKPGGRLSVLVPGNLATDNGATGLRHLLIEEATLEELLSFENRKKIFKLVDSRSKIAVVTLNKKAPSINHGFKAFFYRHDLEDMWNEEHKFVYQLALVNKSGGDTYSLLELRQKNEYDILEKLYEKPLLNSEKGIRVTFTSDFHMGQEAHMFRYDGEGQPLIEGKDIFSYGLSKQSTGTIMYKDGLNRMKQKELFRLKTLGLNDIEPAFYGDYYRIAFRAVSSSTNKRTLMATVTPKNVFLTDRVPANIPIAFNTQHNQYELTLTEKDMFVLLGLMNSFVVDFVIRRKVTTTINLFYMYQLPFPKIRENSNYFEEIVIRAAKLICTSIEYNDLAKVVGLSGYEQGVTDQEKRQLIQNQIDAYIAVIFGLTRDELIYILSTFESPKHKVEMRRIGQGVIEEFDDLLLKGELECPI
jgi:hypothetical protein